MSRMFGTDGVRGIANTELTPILAFKLGQAGAAVLTSAIHKPRILVGRDTRISGQMLESALVAGIMSVGADAMMVGVIPTPAVAFLTRYYSCDAGVMISASHNSVEFNGIKFFNANGLKLPDALEDKIEQLIQSDGPFQTPTGIDVGKMIVLKNAHRDYMDFLEETLDLRLDGLKVVLDCANGASSEVAPQVFEELGATVLPFYNMPDGTNINKNCGSTHISRICQLVAEQGADIGLAFDGDADRLIACDERGAEVDGDRILAICGLMLHKENKLKNNTVVGTVMSNMGLDISVRQNHIELKKTAVGDRYVLECMLKEGYSLGGESSGHIIFLDYNTTGDGILTALQLLRAKVLANLEMSELASVMEKLPQVLVNIRIDNAKKGLYDKDPLILDEIKKAEEALADTGRVLVRASGTEPLVRVMLEGTDKETINQLAINIAEAVARQLDGEIQS